MKIDIAMKKHVLTVALAAILTATTLPAAKPDDTPSPTDTATPTPTPAPPVANSPLLETSAQSDIRYGTPSKTDDNGTRHYTADGFNIAVEYVNGLSSGIHYTKLESGAAISDAEVGELLNKFAPFSTWKKATNLDFWATKDQAFRANHFDKAELIVSTAAPASPAPSKSTAANSNNSNTQSVATPEPEASPSSIVEQSTPSPVATPVATPDAPMDTPIGESPAQSDARYGAPIKITDYGMRAYEKAGFIIGVQYFNNKSDNVMYRKSEVDAINNPLELSDNEIEIILKKNSPNSAWKERNMISMNREWETEDGSLTAEYRSMDHILIVMTMDAVKRADDAKKASEKENLQGL